LLGKHILLGSLGLVFTAILFLAIFKLVFFPTILDNDNDEDNEDDGPSMHKKDLSDALQDLGELGSEASYCGAQILFSKLFCNNYGKLDIACEQSSTALNVPTIILMMMSKHQGGEPYDKLC
jgi:hypothetical protein